MSQRTGGSVPWPTARLGDVAAITRGASPRPINSPRWFDEAGKVGWVRISDLSRSDGMALQETAQRLSADGIARSRFLPPGTLIMSIAATVGAVTVTGIPVCIHDGFVALEGLHDVDQRYIQYFLGSIREKLQAAGQTGSQANLNTAIVKNIEVPLPSRAEQAAIAEVLSDRDRQISTIKRLIAKKRAIKQGMMQQLLSGRTRLPGFNEPWQRRHVAEMGEVLAGKALDAGGVGKRRPYLRTKNVLDGRIDVADVLHMPMTDIEFERFRIEPGDILLNEGQSLELVGRCSVYRGEHGAPVAMQNQLLRFRAFPQTSPEFAAHLFRNCQQSGVFAGISTKTTSIAHLGGSRLRGLQLSWPTRLTEQRAIAAVLTDADAEISTLEARLAKARAVKRGMMQQLLTGKIRLPITDSTTEDLAP